VTLHSYVDITENQINMQCDGCGKTNIITDIEMFEKEQMRICPKCIIKKTISKLFVICVCGNLIDYPNEKQCNKETCRSIPKIIVEKFCCACNSKFNISHEYNFDVLKNIINNELNNSNICKEDLLKLYERKIKLCSELIILRLNTPSFISELNKIFKLFNDDYIIKFSKLFEEFVMDHGLLYIESYEKSNMVYSSRINLIIYLTILHIKLHYNINIDNYDQLFEVNNNIYSEYYETILSNKLSVLINQNNILVNKKESLFFLSNTKFHMSSKNNVELLICGEDTFKRIHESIENSKSFIYIVGWMFNSKLSLKRDGNSPNLKELLIQKSKEGVKIKILIWNDINNIAKTDNEDSLKDLEDLENIECVLSSNLNSIDYLKIGINFFSHHQ
jgi:hypothetical protein